VRVKNSDENKEIMKDIVALETVDLLNGDTIIIDVLG
jgi:hypothetical protein